MPLPIEVVKSSQGLSKTLTVAGRSATRWMILIPSIIDLVALSHSAMTRMSPAQKLRPMACELANDPHLFTMRIAAASSLPNSLPRGRTLHDSALTLGLRSLTSANCMILRSCYLVSADYLADAARCLDCNQDIASVVAQVRSYIGQDNLYGNPGQISLMVGDAAISGRGKNAYGEFGFVVRTDLAPSVGLRSETGYLCDWAFIQSLAQQGHQIAVSLKVGIAGRTLIEADYGTPIDELSRLTHIVATDRKTRFLHAPVMRFPISLIRGQVNHQRIEAPSWYFHMLENGYEFEVAFMTKIFGISRLGRFIRSNARFSSFTERLVGRLSKFGPK